MYEYLTGTLISKQADHIIVETSGVGYRLKVSFSTYEQLPAVGETLKINTYLHVREDIFELFGFAQPLEREFFFKLIAISKIGPKAAMAILSGGSPAEIVNWVMAEDAKTIAKTPGVGPTTAKRIILELKPKFAKGLGGVEVGELTSDLDHTAKIQQEAVLALEALGYSRTEVYTKITKIVKNSPPNLTTEALIKRVLQK